MSGTSATSVRDHDVSTETVPPAKRQRSQALADRLEQGARGLATFAGTITATEWETRIPRDGRKIGVVVHHVASMYPIEIQLAVGLASGRPVEGLSWDDVHALNAKHAEENDAVTKEEALELLRGNSETASAVVRSLSDAELDRAAPVSLNANAPLTCQFFIEDHALRHSYYHLARIRGTLGR